MVTIQHIQPVTSCSKHLSNNIINNLIRQLTCFIIYDNALLMQNNEVNVISNGNIF